MNRFFVNKDNIYEDQGKILITESEDIKHITKVLRLTIGDEVEICNKEKVDYIASISDISKSQVECIINQKYLSKTEAPIEIVLFQGVPKASKMDLIIQKTVEVGVKEIVPILSHRCVVKIKDQSSERKKVERWQKIAFEAAKQCKRGIVPKVKNVVEFENLKSLLEDLDLVIIPYEEEKNNGIKKIITSKKGVKKIGIIIGPEGGFTQEEVKKVIDFGGFPVSLGPRILRTETAGLVTTSVLMYELGDLGGN